MHFSSRRVLFDNLRNINGLNNFNDFLFTSELLLYGMNTLSDAANKQIILSTIKFLVDSNRFNNILIEG